MDEVKKLRIGADKGSPLLMIAIRSDYDCDPLPVSNSAISSGNTNFNLTERGRSTQQRLDTTVSNAPALTIIWQGMIAVQYIADFYRFFTELAFSYDVPYGDKVNKKGYGI